MGARVAENDRKIKVTKPEHVQVDHMSGRSFRNMLDIVEEFQTADKLFDGGKRSQKLIDYISHRNKREESNRDSGSRPKAGGKDMDSTNSEQTEVTKQGVRYRAQAGESGMRTVWFTHDRLRRIVRTMVKAILGCQNGEKMYQCTHCPFHLEEQKHDGGWLCACGTAANAAKYGKTVFDSCGLNPCIQEWLCQEPAGLEIFKKHAGKDWDKVSTILETNYSGIHGCGRGSKKSDTPKKANRVRPQKASEDTAAEQQSEETTSAYEEQLAKIQQQADSLCQMMAPMQAQSMAPMRVQRAATVPANTWQQPTAQPMMSPEEQSAAVHQYQQQMLLHQQMMMNPSTWVLPGSVPSQQTTRFATNLGATGLPAVPRRSDTTRLPSLPSILKKGGDAKTKNN